MLPALILALAALAAVVWRLAAYRAQMLEMARVLEETPPEIYGDRTHFRAFTEQFLDAGRL